MIELDRVLKPIAKYMNACYESLFPGLCQYPQFSFSRAMIILWKKKVYMKIKSNLIDAFVPLLKEQREDEIKTGRAKTQSLKGEPVEPAFSFCLLTAYDNENVELLTKFVQAVADLSTDELTIHYLGSTKAQLQEPYAELNKLILNQTK